MKNFLFLLLLFLSATLSGHAETSKTAEAENAYAQKDYVKAAQIYETLLASPEGREMSSPTRSTIHYNLGNCYYRTKDFGKAVLHYQRCLRLNPSDKDAAFNLELTQSKLTDRFDSPSEMFFFTWWRNASNAISATAWGFCALALVVLSFCLIQLYRARVKNWLRKAGLATSALCMAAALLCFLFAYHQSTYYDHLEQAVIMQETETYANPTSTAQKGKTLHEGTIVTLKNQPDGNWQQIELPDGTETWVKYDKSLIVKC